MSEFLIATLHKDSQPVKAEFSDGPRIIPEFVVDLLGGNESFTAEFLEGMKDITFAQFMEKAFKEFRREEVTNAANNYVKNFLNIGMGYF